MIDPTVVTSILALGNLILSSANVIISFSLLAYILTHNFRSPVARAFLALLTFMTIVHVGDVIVANVETESANLLWLRFQWCGIAFVPAAYMQFSDAVLRTTGSVSNRRRHATWLCYALSFGFFILAGFTDLLVEDGTVSEWVSHLATGRLFWSFIVYFAITTTTGLRRMGESRRRCLTSTSRRRMTYLGLASIAPAMGVFPYLLIATVAESLTTNWIYFISLVGNAGIAGMIIVMAYAVAYQGVLTPDRVIKHNMIHYLLRGPLVGIAIIALMLIVPQVERILGLPRDMVLIFAVIIGIVTFQVAISVAKPYIDRLIYRGDREELTWIQTLDQRLFTTTDLEQLLESILTTLCDFMRVRTGFVVVMEDRALSIRILSGSRDQAEQFLARFDLAQAAKLFSRNNGAAAANPPAVAERKKYPNGPDFVLINGYWLLPLYAQDHKTILGVMGIEARSTRIFMQPSELETVAELVSQAEHALEDTRLQQEVFETLRRLEPEISVLQRLRSTPHFAKSGRISALESQPVDSPDLAQWVKEALSHYWGGPQLSTSPLLQLKIVERALPLNDGVPAKALRSVLEEAIERQRPPGERRLTASEWLIYNLLELRFVKGIRIRDVAQRLAISESDFYRKQRVAIEQIAKTLADMEREVVKGRPA
ncbi:MAG: hypothetical protein GXY76_06530 [Chloroflexi bacterium]|nr:hypothetical protein [Chloroflexota bacterium]